MEVKKAIKKVLALATGVSMIGTTLLGAMAADLADYPSPFVKNGAFDALIVVGEKAAAEDVVGSIDIAQSLQYAVAVPVSGTTTTTTVSTVSEGKKIEKSGDNFNFGETAQSILPSTPAKIGASDLPSILADGIYTDDASGDEDYTQEIVFGTGNLNLTYMADESDEEIVDDYLVVNENLLYTYRVKFDDGVDLKDTDANCVTNLENTKINIQGKQYTVSDAECTELQTDKNATIKKLTLMAGDTVMWLQQDQVITKTVEGVEHEIMVVDVTQNEDSCGVSVDGTTKWIDEGKTETLNGVKIGISDAKAVYSQLQDTDICEVNIGADDVILEDNKEVKVGGSDIDGSDVKFEQAGTSGGTGKWTAMNITYTPEDAEYLKVGSSWTDPVLGNFKVVLSALKQDTEDIKISDSSDKGAVEFTSDDGDKISIPFYRNGASAFWGDTDNTSTMVFYHGGVANLTQDNVFVTCYGSSGTWYKKCQDTLFLYTDSGHVPHLLEVDSITNSSSSTEIQIQDKTTGRTYTDTTFSITASGDSVDLGTLGSVTISLANTNVTGGSSGTLIPAIKIDVPDVDMYTDKGANITLGDDGANVTVTVKEDAWATRLSSDPAATTIATRVYVGGTNSDEIALDKTTTMTYNDLTPSDSNDDERVSKTRWGTKVHEADTTATDNTITISYPADAVVADVYVSPTQASVTTTSASGTPVTLTKINVGSAKLDSEVDAKAQNVILVGGPCANKAAAEWAGVTEANCAEGFEAGKGMLKLYESAGKVALLVAGYSAADTRATSRVVANYEDYALTGTEMVVSYTDLSSITVKAPQ